MKKHKKVLTTTVNVAAEESVDSKHPVLVEVANLGPTNSKSVLEAAVEHPNETVVDENSGAEKEKNLKKATTDHGGLNAVKLPYAGYSCLVTTGESTKCTTCPKGNDAIGDTYSGDRGH